jgi:hypothetical protein
MSPGVGTAAGSSALKAEIRAVERRIRQRRQRIGVAAGRAAANIRGQLISPSVLIGAGLFGAAMHFSQRVHGLRLLAVFQTASTGLRRVLAVPARTSAPPD